MTENLNTYLPLVSIIVAVYNVEQYLQRSITALRNQTYRNIEIILVDDGSKDQSGAICDEFAQLDNRIKVIHKANGGVSTARQAGLDAATGDYVIHSDPDDYVDSMMIEELVKKAESDHADMVFCDFYLNENYYSLQLDKKRDLLRRLIDVDIVASCWNTLLRKTFIDEHNIKFHPDWLCYSEDFLFLIRCVVAKAKFTYLNKAFYHYNAGHEDSLSNTTSYQVLHSIQKVIEEISLLVDEKQYNNFYQRKKYAIMKLFFGKQFTKMKQLYPEIHEQLIIEGNSDEWQFHSIENVLSYALKHSPQRAYIRMKIQRGIMKFKSHHNQ